MPSRIVAAAFSNLCPSFSSGRRDVFSSPSSGCFCFRLARKACSMPFHPSYRIVFPFGGKCVALGLQNCQHRLKAVGLGGSTEKAAGKEHQDIPLTGRQSRQVGAGYLHRGENGMVVRYLAVINNSFQLRLPWYCPCQKAYSATATGPESQPLPAYPL